MRACTRARCFSPYIPAFFCPVHTRESLATPNLEYPRDGGSARRRRVQSCVSSSGSSLSFTSWSTLEATGFHVVTHTQTHGTVSWPPGFYKTHTHTHTTHCDARTHTHTITSTHTHTHKDKHMHINIYKRTLTHAHKKTYTRSPHFP